MYEKQTPNFAAEDISGGPVFSQSEIARQQIEQWTKDKLPGGQIVQLGSPSAILQSFGMDDLPIHLTKSVLDKAKNKHTVDPDDLLGLADAIHSPIAVFASKQGDGHLVVLTELKHADGNIIAALDLNKSRDHFEIHDIRSLHPKNTKSVLKWIEDGLLLGYEKTKGREWLERNSGSDSQRGQVNAAFEGARIYEAEKNSNTPNKSSFDESTALYQSTNEAPRLAPNGKPSNLNPLQYAQVRTAAFKKWFGDWLHNPEMEMTPIKLVDDPNLPIDGDAKTLSKYLRDTFGNTKEINQQTGDEIGFYRDGIEASVKNRKLLSRRLYAILPQLLRESAYAGYEENTKLDKKPHVLGYETYYAAVSIDGKVYSVRIAVDRIKNDVRGRGYYYHQVDEVSLGDEVGSTRVLSDSTNQASTPSSPNGKIILSQLTGKVNNDASKVIDENGEPLVVYHGSDEGFDTFLKEKIGTNIVLPNGAPRGFYFAKDKALAEKYGKTITEAFISGKPLLNNSKIVVAGEPNQIKSATGNNGNFDGNDANILHQQQYGSFHPPTNTIAIFKQGNLSTVLHELGHFFFENDIALAAELFTKPELTAGEQQIVSDVSALLNWSGIQGTLQEQLDQWYSMDIEEKRGAHERTAEAFEAYLFTGTAPSIELQHAFQTFRTWLISVYKSLKDFLASHPEAGKLNEEVSAIFDRMLATEEEIKLAEKARSLMPLFESAQKAGMSEADFAAYQALGVEATNTAIDALQAKALGDMEWMGRAHTQYLKALQKKHDELRREVRSQARTDIMAQPVYRAYSFLTGKLSKDDKIAQPTTAKSNPKHVDPSIDSLFVAIAKLGGLQRGQLTEEWNYDHQGRVQMPVFGKPVVRKNGGLSIETMAESLMDEGYLNMDEHGKYDLHEFEEKFSAELRGVSQYAHSVDGGNITQEDHKAREAVINPDGLGAGRFELSELRGMDLPEAVLNLMINLKMTAKDGLHPDIVSDLFGFSSGDELVNALASAENPKAAIEHLTDQRMLQEHGELATPEAVEEAANRAVHNKFRERLLRSEANALAKATGSLRLLGNAAKEYTQAMISRLKVRDIRPINYSRAEVKAARAAEQAHRKGDTEQAAIEKRNQVLNMQAFRAAVAAQDHIDKMLRYFKRLGGDGQKIDAEYIDVIRGMLDKFDLRDQSGKHLDEQARLRAWVQSQLAEGQLPVIAESLLSPQERAAYVAQVESRDEHGELIYQDDEEALKLLADAIDRSAKRSYKDATYEELQGLYETIKQMEHLGRLKHKLLTAQDERDADAIYTEITDGIILHGGAGGKNTRTPNDVLGKMLAGIKDFGSAHIKIATWARIMDGGIDNGPVWRFLVKPANARATQETTMKAAATKELDAIMRPILAKATLRDKSGKGKYFASIGTSLNWQERFSFLLNMGNESNLQRLMGGGIATVKENLTMAQLLEVVGTLSWDEALAVQKIWDHFESYRPLIAEKEKRISGVEPQWVAIRPIDIKVNDGRVITLRGGYFPVKFDPRVNRMAEAHASAQDAKNLMKASYSAATTNRSFIKQRVEEVTGRPLLLNLTGLYSGVNDVIHDLAWHEWVIDANKILKKIDPAIREFYGADVKKQFDTWRNDIVVGQRKLDHGIEKAAAFARQYVSASALTFNLMSAAMQPLGIANTMARIGPHWVGQGIAIYTANPLQATKDAQQKSEWLRNRTRTRFRELNELRNQVQGQTAAKELMGRYGYWLMMRAQMMVDIPSWHGGYEKAIAQGFDEDTAIALADQAVKDSQGGGEEVDQSGIERGHALVKLFTAFYGFMGTTLNTAYGSTITEKSKAKIATNLLLTLSVPAVLGSLLRSALTPGDDDDENLAGTLIREQLAFMMGLIAFGREFAGITKDNHMGYSGPTGLRLIPDTFKLVDQIKQGDFDTAFRKQFVNVLGDISGLPAVQINRTWDGIEALNSGDTSNPAAIGFGYKKPHHDHSNNSSSWLKVF